MTVEQCGLPGTAGPTILGQSACIDQCVTLPLLMFWLLKYKDEGRTHLEKTAFSRCLHWNVNLHGDYFRDFHLKNQRILHIDRQVLVVVYHHSTDEIYSPMPFLCLTKISANERRCYIHNVSSHWLKSFWDINITRSGARHYHGMVMAVCLWFQFPLIYM